MRIDDLVNLSLSTVADNHHLYGKELNQIPVVLKSQLIKLITRRGSINNKILSLCLTKFITELDLTNCVVNDSTFKIIAAKCPYLSCINLNSIKNNRDDITENDLILLFKTCSKLTIVLLKKCINTTDTAIISLANNCPLLKVLNVGGCKRITDASLAALSKLYHLKSLNFSSTKVTDKGLSHICKSLSAPLIKEIDISGCKKLTDRSVQVIIQHCHDINVLLFHGCIKITENSRHILSYNHNTKLLTWTAWN